jgi:membrane-associated protein
MPTIIVVLAAGSLAALGDLNIFILFFIVTVCSVLGDIVGYWLGTKIGYGIFHKHKSNSIFSFTLFDRLKKYFFRWSGITIFLTRWLFSLFSALTNILAGMTRYSFRKFLLFDIPGEIVSAMIFLGIGYIFSSQWQNIWINIENLLLFITGISIGIICIYLGIKRLQKLGKL